MKRILAFVLTVMLLMGMAIPASAAGTGSAVTKPFLVSSTSKDCVVYFDNEIHKLSKTAQEIFEDALEKEDEVLVSDEMIPLDLLYVSTSEMCTVELRVGKNSGAIVKQYINGKWSLMESKMKDEEIMTVENVVEGPMLIYTVSKVSSPTAPVTSPTAPVTSATATAPLPVLISAASDNYTLYAAKDVYKLSLKARQTFIDAQKALPSAAPSGMTARYFFYMYTNTPCTAVFEIKNISEVDFVQYVNGKWVELKSTIDTDDTVTVEQVTEGPMAIFTK